MEKVLQMMSFVGLCALFICCCSEDNSEDSAAHEGDDPGECEDDADNDRDGFFDCDDPDCAGSAACSEPGTGDGDVDGDSDGDSDGDTDSIEPTQEDIDRISGFIDSLPWGQEAIDAVGKRGELIDAVYKACELFGPPEDEWKPWCQGFLIAAACRESSLQIDYMDAIGDNPSVGLLQIRFGFAVKDLYENGNVSSVKRIGCDWPDFSDLTDDDWATQGNDWLDFLQDVPCNIAVGSWFYFLYATGNGEPTVYSWEYCAGDGIPSNLIIGMLSYVSGPSNGVYDEDDPYASTYTSLIKEYFDNMFEPVPAPHPFERTLSPYPDQYCGAPTNP